MTYKGGDEGVKEMVTTNGHVYGIIWKIQILVTYWNNEEW
jgi:hypothetical protein